MRIPRPERLNREGESAAQSGDAQHSRERTCTRTRFDDAPKRLAPFCSNEKCHPGRGRVA